MELHRDFAVDEVEDVRHDHDDPGEEKTPGPQRISRQDVDEDADKGQDVRMDPELHACGDDRAQGKHADRADRPGERETRLAADPTFVVAFRLGGGRETDRVSHGVAYNGGFSVC